MAASSEDPADPTCGPAPDPTWAPHVPHRQIDALIDRLAMGETTDPAEAYRLLGMVAKEAQRLRTMVVRLSTAKLADADREARFIVAEALGHADAMRSVGLSVLNTRLDEADRLLATMREAFRVELRAAEIGQVAGEQHRSAGSSFPADPAGQGR